MFLLEDLSLVVELSNDTKWLYDTQSKNWQSVPFELTAPSDPLQAQVKQSNTQNDKAEPQSSFDF